MTHKPLEPFYLCVRTRDNLRCGIEDSRADLERDYASQIAAGTHRIAGPFCEAQAQARKVVQVSVSIDGDNTLHTAIADDGSMWEYGTGYKTWEALPPIPQPSAPAPDLLAELRALVSQIKSQTKNGLDEDGWCHGWVSGQQKIASSIDAILARAGGTDNG